MSFFFSIERNISNYIYICIYACDRLLICKLFILLRLCKFFLDEDTLLAKSIRNRTYKSLRPVVFRDNYALSPILKKRNQIDLSNNKDRLIYLEKLQIIKFI